MVEELVRSLMNLTAEKFHLVVLEQGGGVTTTPYEMTNSVCAGGSLYFSRNHVPVLSTVFTVYTVPQCAS